MPGIITGRLRKRILKKHAAELPAIDLFPVTVLAKDWNDAQRKFFAEGGVFDQVSKVKSNARPLECMALKPRIAC